MWHGFKFTHVRKAGAFHGWEATCYNSDHSETKLCRRTLTLKPDEPLSKEFALRRLRWWCLAGRAEGCNTHERYKKVPCKGPANDETKLPSPADLDNQA